MKERKGASERGVLLARPPRKKKEGPHPAPPRRRKRRPRRKKNTFSCISFRGGKKEALVMGKKLEI